MSHHPASFFSARHQERFAWPEEKIERKAVLSYCAAVLNEPVLSDGKGIKALRAILDDAGRDSMPHGDKN